MLSSSSSITAASLSDEEGRAADAAEAERGRAEEDVEAGQQPEGAAVATARLLVNIL